MRRCRVKRPRDRALGKVRRRAAELARFRLRTISVAARGARALSARMYKHAAAPETVRRLSASADDGAAPDLRERLRRQLWRPT